MRIENFRGFQVDELSLDNIVVKLVGKDFFYNFDV